MAPLLMETFYLTHYLQRSQRTTKLRGRTIRSTNCVGMARHNQVTSWWSSWKYFSSTKFIKVTICLPTGNILVVKWWTKFCALKDWLLLIALNPMIKTFGWTEKRSLYVREICSEDVLVGRARLSWLQKWGTCWFAIEIQRAYLFTFLAIT